MAEYWKSTPKYWCKFCKTYVRDTKFEKQQHEATPKHQNNIQRSLRELHKGQEREEREKQRAKDEVARLNGVVSSGGASSVSKDPPWKKGTPLSAPPKQATPEERKRQLAQLAELGVAVPEEFRREMAMAGDWQVLSENPAGSTLDQKSQDEKQPLNIGIRKRKLEGEDEEEDATQKITKRKGWGQTFKAFPSSKAGDEDLDALLNISKLNQTPAIKDEAEVKDEPDIKEIDIELEPEIKEEPREHTVNDVLSANTDTSDQTIKAEPDAPSTAVVFKKRKNKAIRQK